MNLRRQLHGIRQDLAHWLVAEIGSDGLQGLRQSIEAILLRSVVSCVESSNLRERIEGVLRPLIPTNVPKLTRRRQIELGRKMRDLIQLHPHDDFLGLCYETGLDYAVELRDGRVVMEGCDGRWSSGSFYTPSFIVAYIVKRV